MWLQTRMFLLVAVLFGILYGVITGIGTWMGTGSAVSYIVLAFFLNDPSRAWSEIRELSQIDRDMSGTIDYDELMELRQ